MHVSLPEVRWTGNVETFNVLLGLSLSDKGQGRVQRQVEDQVKNLIKSLHVSP